MKRYRSGLVGTGALALLTMAMPAKADIIATMAFTTPNGIVGPSDSIPIWLTLTLDPSSDPLMTDFTGQVTTLFSPADLAELGGDTSWSIRLATTAVCLGSFIPTCGPGDPYTFTYAGYGAPDSFLHAVNVDLQPGSVSQWLLGSFDPVGGAAPAGDYVYYSAHFFIDRQVPVDPTDLGGAYDFFILSLAQTCNPIVDGCAFHRTVVGNTVPEPANWAMLIAGFGLVGAAMRRRRALPANA